jgi:hypothetical protein
MGFLAGSGRGSQFRTDAPIVCPNLFCTNMDVPLLNRELIGRSYHQICKCRFGDERIAYLLITKPANADLVMKKRHSGMYLKLSVAPWELESLIKL